MISATKHIAIFFMAMIFVSEAGAASALWDAVTCNTSGVHQQLSVLTDGPSPSFWAVFNVGVDVSGERAVLTANPGGERVLSYAGAWMRASCGDDVEADSMLGAASYFEYGILGSGAASEESISVKIGVSSYLKFVLQDSEQCFEYQEGSRTMMPDLYCGWAEYVVDPEGSISVVSSAIDVLGRPIRVGYDSVPEPSCGLLLLVGIAALSLRRKRVAGNEGDA